MKELSDLLAERAHLLMRCRDPHRRRVGEQLLDAAAELAAVEDAESLAFDADPKTFALLNESLAHRLQSHLGARFEKAEAS